MKKLKRLLVSIVLLAMLITLLITPGQVGAFASDAQKCVTLNLLKGDAGVTDAYLAKTSTRLQSAIISLRLSGLEQKALTFNGSATFTDAGKVNWEGGRKILAYLKANPQLGWVGNPDGSFKPNDNISAQAMHKVLLEVLGYKQGVDFTWGNVMSFARSHGFSKTLDASTFTNANIASAMLEVLNLKLKGSDIQLIQALVNSRLVTAAKAIAAGFTVTSVYPIKTNVTLKYWSELSAVAAATLQDYGQSEMYKEMEKKTGVKLEFKHPPQGQTKEQFSLMIASRDLPDLMEYNWTTYTGGPEKAISDNIIIKLNNLIDTDAPNLKKYLDSKKDVKKQLTTESGSLYVFPSIDISTYKGFGGLGIRKDWLQDLGLKPPVTIDEWTVMLREFKNKKGAKAPFTSDKSNMIHFNNYDPRNAFNSPYNVGISFYLDKGKVKYGPIEPAFKDYLKLMNSWYTEGLLDPDFATVDAKGLDAKITGGKAGAFYTFTGSGIGKYVPMMKEKEPRFDILAVPNPVMKKGEEPRFTLRNLEYNGAAAVAVTTTNKYPVVSARLLDFLYTEEGKLLVNFGVEGLSYYMVNGYPTYTNLIMKNPDKLSIANALGKYTRANTPAPGYKSDDRYLDQYYELPSQKESIKIWNKYAENALEVQYPTSVAPNTEEAGVLAPIMSEINTYVAEMYLKFIMGTEPLSNFDKFTSQINAMKIGKAIEIKQNALNRYNSR